MKNIESFTIFGLNFHLLNMSQSIELLEDFIKDKSKPRMVFTPTAELIVRANEDENLMGIYNKTDILTVDSYVVYYVSRLLGVKVPEPVSAARLMLNFLPVADKKNYSIFLLGAKEEIVKKTAENINLQFPGIKIAGWHHGYFEFEQDSKIVNEIKEKKPDVLFVAMSSPLKEKFITKNLYKMNVPVSIGVGGTFDIIAGKCNLAPSWISKLGLEWFYRFCQEPHRLWKRYLITNSKFIWLVIKEYLKQRRREKQDGRI